MKMTFISDTHGKHEHLTSKAYNNILGSGDVLVHAGDCTNVGKVGEIKDFLDCSKGISVGNYLIESDIIWVRFK